MAGYIFTSLILLIYLVVGTILIIKTPTKLTMTKKIILAIVLFSAHFFPMVETVTNSNVTNHYFLMYLPNYNYTPIMFYIAIIAILTKGKVSNLLKVLVILMMIPILYGIGDQMYVFMKTFKGFYERFAVYTIGQATIVLYGIYLIRNKEVNIKVIDIILTMLIILAMYLFSYLHNLNFGTTFFGLTLDNNCYIYDSIKLEDYNLSLIYNFVSIQITMLITGIFTKVITYKIKKKD